MKCDRLQPLLELSREEGRLEQRGSLEFHRQRLEVQTPLRTFMGGAGGAARMRHEAEAGKTPKLYLKACVIL